MEYPGCHFAFQMKCDVLCYLWLTLPMSSLASCSCEPAHAAKCRPATRKVLKLVWISHLSDHHWRPHLELAFLIAQRPPFHTYVSLSALLPTGSCAFGLTFSVLFASLVRICEFVGQQSVTTDLHVFPWVSFRTIIFKIKLHNQL